jgi:hypothetical protein
VDDLVLPAGGKGFAVGAEGDPHDGFLVGAKGMPGNARFRIPEDNVLVGASRGEGLPIGTEIHGPDDRRVPMKNPVGAAAEGRAEEGTREDCLYEPHDPLLLLGLDILFLVGGKTGGTGGKAQQGGKAQHSYRP